jgi:hypothetical protein
VVISGSLVTSRLDIDDRAGEYYMLTFDERLARIGGS